MGGGGGSGSGPVGAGTSCPGSTALGLDASVEWWARRQRCSLRCGGLGVRTQPLLLPRADRPAAALVPSTSHGAARIMIELRNKHTLTGKLCCFQIVLLRAARRRFP